MKKYLLPILTFFFSVFLSFSLLAQGNGGGNGGNGNGGNGGNKYEIEGNQQPCVGSIETYTITPNPGNNAIEWSWDDPRASDGGSPWVLQSLSADKTKATFLVGDKPGTIKAKPIPGSNNTENLPVHPGKDVQISIKGPNTVCVNTQQVYQVVIGNLGNGKKGGKNISLDDLVVSWNLPTGLNIISGQNTGTLTVMPSAAFTGGSVSVTVTVPGQNSGPNNNGKGVGPITGFCNASATANLQIALGSNCNPACPATTVSIAGPVTVCPAPAEFSLEDAVTYTAEVQNGTADMDYIWTLPTGWKIVAGAGSNKIQVRVGAEPGSVQVRVNNNCSGAASASRFVAFGNDCPIPTSECPTPQVIINGPGSVCANQASTVKYSASVTNTGFVSVTYNWTVPAGWEIVAGLGSSEIEVKVGSAAGAVGLNVTNDCGNQVPVTRTIVVTDCGTTPPPCTAPTVSINGPTSFCAFQEEPVTFTASVTNNTPDITYTWEVPADWFIASQVGPTIEVYVGFEAGPVTVTVRNNCNEATDVLMTTVDENCQPLEPLPVELISFTGESAKGGVLLTWSTATEKDNDYFELERSQDGKQFAKVGQVKGKGTTNSRQVYSMRDGRAGEGTLYYRLKQVDFDGKFEYSKVIAVKHNYGPALANLLVAPNPVAGGQFTVQLPATTAKALVQITDMNGRLIATQNLDAGVSQATFSTQALNLRAGIYIVQFKDGSNVSHTKMIVR